MKNLKAESNFPVQFSVKLSYFSENLTTDYPDSAQYMNFNSFLRCSFTYYTPFIPLKNGVFKCNK